MKGICAAALSFVAFAGTVPLSQTHECEVAGRDFAFTPTRIVVHVNDLVRIRFHADDIPHAIAIVDSALFFFSADLSQKYAPIGVRR